MVDTIRTDAYLTATEFPDSVALGGITPQQQRDFVISKVHVADLWDDPTNAQGLGAPAIIRGTLVVDSHLAGLTMGSTGGNQATQIANATALQNAFNYAVASKKIIEVHPGLYEYYSTSTSGLNVPHGSGNIIVYRGCGASSVFTNFYASSAGNPVFTFGDITGANYMYYPDIQGAGSFKRGTVRAAPGTPDLTVDCAIGPVAWGRVSDVFTGNRAGGAGGTTPGNPSTYGVLFVTPSGSTATFSSIFDNFNISGATVDIAHMPILGSGNVYRNWYLNGGGSQGTTPPIITGSALNAGGGGASNEQTWEQLNIEWVSCGTAMNLSNMLGGHFIACHIEGVALTGTFAQLISLGNSTVLFDGLTAETFNTLAMTSGQAQVFYSNSSNLQVNTAVINESSAASNLTFPLTMYFPQANTGLDSQNQATFSNIKFQDDSGNTNLAAFMSVDTHMPLGAAQFRRPYTVGRYQYGSGNSILTGADTQITANYTHYGQNQYATLEVPAVLSANITITLSHAMGATGTMPMLAGNWVHVRRQNNGTFTNTLTVVDSATPGTNLINNTAVNQDFFLAWNGTAWALVTNVN